MSTSTNTEAAVAAAAAASASLGRRCAACKNQRRKCSEDCILAPYFPASDPQRYAFVQRVFGASNVARMLQNLPVHERGKAADTMAMEAQRRMQDPVYGCAGIVGRLQGEIRAVQCELARTQAQIAVHAQLNSLPRQQQQAGGAQVMPEQDPFQGLDTLLVDDYRVYVHLVDDDMNTD